MNDENPSESLRICLVGGIYGKESRFGSSLQSTPELTLEQGLRSRGHVVLTASHFASIDPAKFDIVHVHHLSYGAVRAALNKSTARFVFTNHDSQAITGGLPRPRELALKFVLRAADGIIALSENELRFYRDKYRIAESRCAVIPNGIDAAAYTFKPKLPVRPGDRWKLLFVGQLIPLKRVDLLLSALARLSSNVELDLVYHVDTLEQALKEKACQLGISERVHFLGPKSKSELANLYHSAHVLVLCSDHEALPSVISEAMLCGTPVVASEVGGIPQQLGRFGTTTPAGDVVALANTISGVLFAYNDHLTLAPEMSAYARQRFSIESMVSQHLSFYDVIKNSLCPVRLTSQMVPGLHQIGNVGLSLICKMK